MPLEIVVSTLLNKNIPIVQCMEVTPLSNKIPLGIALKIIENNNDLGDEVSITHSSCSLYCNFLTVNLLFYCIFNGKLLLL